MAIGYNNTFQSVAPDPPLEELEMVVVLLAFLPSYVKSLPSVSVDLCLKALLVMQIRLHLRCRNMPDSAHHHSQCSYDGQEC